MLSGSQYSGGAVGENRGVLYNANITIADETFKRSQYVSAGAVGFNLGGLVKEVDVTANIIKTEYSQTSSGIVGRNVNGTIANAHYDGEIISYFAGGIVGANYSDEILLSATTGTGAIHGECKQNSNLIPTAQIAYWDNDEKVENFDNVSLSINALNKMIDNLTKFYSYKNDTSTNNGTLSSITIKSKVLGLVAGLSYNTNAVSKTDNCYHINYDTQNNKIIFNSSVSSVSYVDSVNDVILKDATNDADDVKFNFTNVNVLDIAIDNAQVLYLVGSSVLSFDSWSNYTDEYVLIK